MNRIRPITNRISECFLERPVWVYHTVSQGLLLDYQYTCPLRKSLRFSLISHQMVITFIIALFFTRSPATILFRIRTVIVDTINRMFWTRARAHIAVEVQERVLPSSTDRNSPTPIAWKIFIKGIQDSIFQPTPDSILRGKARIVCHPVRNTGTGQFYSQTATTPRSAIANTPKRNNSFCSTYTSTYPTGFPMLARSATQKRPPFVSLLSTVNKVMSLSRSTSFSALDARQPPRKEACGVATPSRYYNVSPRY